MKLRYPISSELFTFVHSLNRSIERGIRAECDLSVVQYRALSCMRQAGELWESQMERIMAVSASRLSQALGALALRGLATSRRAGGPAKLWQLTEAGNQVVEQADIVLVEACNQVFGPLGPELGRAIRSGSMLTNQRHGVVRIEKGRFFEEHACFEAFLQAEVFTKEITQSYHLSETEFRIMFELLVGGPASKSALARSLMLAPSVVTDASRALADRGLVTTTAATTDKRVRTLALTEAGRTFTEEVAEHVDSKNYEDLRPSSTDERALYQRMADIFVRDGG